MRFLHLQECVTAGQLIEQRLRFLQIAGVEPLREPPVNRSQQFAGLLHLALRPSEAWVAPVAGEKRGGSTNIANLTELLRGVSRRAITVACGSVAACAPSN